MSELEVFIERIEIESGLVNPVEWFIEKYDLKRKDRTLEIKTLRQYLMYLCRKNLRQDKASYMKIARMFEKDHTTIIFAERKVKDLLQTKDKYIRHIITKYSYDINMINWEL
jgi:chromosomal replication initiation ATPase DnaA